MLSQINTKNDLFVPDSMYESSISHFRLLLIKVIIQLLISLYNASSLLKYYVLDPLFQVNSSMLNILVIDAYNKSNLLEKLPLTCSSA
jgi:hypothetical protein